MTQKSQTKRNMLIGASLLVVIVMTALYARSRVVANQARSNTFKETIIKRGDVQINIRATGSVLPENRLEIKTPIAGRVESVLVEEGEKVRRGQILAWMSSTERAAVIDAARAKGAEELAKWEDLYRQTPILSPINGTVIYRAVEPGQTFLSTEAVMVLSDRLTVKAQVDETDLAQVKLGMKATVILDAYPNDSISAKVSRIAFEAKTVSNITMYDVDVTPEKSADVMRSGMTATVRFDVASKHDVLVVANEAIKMEGEDAYVMLMDDDEKRVRTSIKVGLSDGKFSEVTSGLKEGDVVSVRILGEASASERATNPFMPTPPRGGRKSGGGGPPP